MRMLNLVLLPGHVAQLKADKRLFVPVPSYGLVAELILLC